MSKFKIDTEYDFKIGQRVLLNGPLRYPDGKIWNKSCLDDGYYFNIARFPYLVITGIQPADNFMAGPANFKSILSFKETGTRVYRSDNFAPAPDLVRAPKTGDTVKIITHSFGEGIKYGDRKIVVEPYIDPSGYLDGVWVAFFCTDLRRDVLVCIDNEDYELC